MTATIVNAGARHLALTSDDYSDEDFDGDLSAGLADVGQLWERIAEVSR